MQLMSSEKIDEKTGCILCGSTRNADYIYSSKSTQDGDSITYDYFRCPDCGLAFLNPRPESAPNRARYDQYYKNLRRLNIIDKTMRVISISDCCRLVTKKTGKKGTILDIGCGSSDFLVAMKRRQWDVYGVEASRLAGEKAKKSLRADSILITDSLAYDFPDESFDAVTLWHVLEHVDNPVLLIKEIRRLLKRGGIAIIEVPNVNSPAFRFFREHHYLNLVPEHLFIWSKEAVQLLLNKSGFEIEEIILFQRSHFALSRNIYKLYNLKHGRRGLAGLLSLLSAPLSVADKYFGIMGGRKDLIRVICRKK